MKRIFCLSMVVFIIMLSGCDINIGFNSSKSDIITDKADEIVNQFDASKKKIKQLAKKEALTSDDQQLIVDEIEKISDKIEEFQSLDGELFTKKIKSIVEKDMKKKMSELIPIQEKANNGEANRKDVEKLIDTLSATFEFSLFD